MKLLSYFSYFIVTLNLLYSCELESFINSLKKVQENSIIHKQTEQNYINTKIYLENTRKRAENLKQQMKKAKNEN